MSLSLIVDLGDKVDIDGLTLIFSRKDGNRAIFLIDDDSEIEQRVTIKEGSVTHINGAKVTTKHRTGRKAHILVNAPRRIKVILHSN